LLTHGGTICLENGDFEGACKEFSKILALDTHNRFARYSLIFAEKQRWPAVATPDWRNCPTAALPLDLNAALQR
jgi:hypothetical protein